MSSQIDLRKPLAGGCRLEDATLRDLNFFRHNLRYLFACPYAHGQVVLDAACGIGYGVRTLHLAGEARKVVGVDISLDAMSGGKENSLMEGVSFVAGDVLALPFPSASIDLFISLETIEHLEKTEAYLSEVKRVLRPAGTYIVSSPNRRFASPFRGWGRPRNPFHAVEWFPGNFFSLLHRHFEQVERFGQVAMKLPRLQEANCFLRHYLNVLLVRPVYRMLGGRGIGNRLRNLYRSFLGPDPGLYGNVPAEARGDDFDPEIAKDHFSVLPIPEGCEPLVMVAVCRKPRMPA